MLHLRSLWPGGTLKHRLTDWYFNIVVKMYVREREKGVVHVYAKKKKKNTVCPWQIENSQYLNIVYSVLGFLNFSRRNRQHTWTSCRYQSDFRQNKNERM